MLAVVAIVALLENPNRDNALRPAIAELYFAHCQSNGSDTRYMDQAREATRTQAIQLRLSAFFVYSTIPQDQIAPAVDLKLRKHEQSSLDTLV